MRMVRWCDGGMVAWWHGGMVTMYHASQRALGRSQRLSCRTQRNQHKTKAAGTATSPTRTSACRYCCSSNATEVDSKERSCAAPAAPAAPAKSTSTAVRLYWALSPVLAANIVRRLVWVGVGFWCCPLIRADARLCIMMARTRPKGLQSSSPTAR